MSERRRQPDLDHVRRAMREHDERPGEEPTEPEPDEPERDENEDESADED